ncbi:hypothetical protein TVAG_436530 [Trichomonas vaginalis G3]|uniref:MatE family protein n=1 Tax=Trichomonas vaginalis (strain ATCC PRA-98 / G3) TaxID=412133 RepID=A2DFA1_TRIV3|nr:multidrug resistance protein YPNP-related family [Trichomonas vaginalis G3]EAY20829.1 hypothetical protein TVAG_436530 [Trichomonas vaginalis G3]KAI5521563.1 multidrug resistance protein YPNP-related family [Trichomonas vaginalis G3]|eukprot:XP_001581815.1 hypothetical protein [Trichomonas vaginalis G3]
MKNEEVKSLTSLNSMEKTEEQKRFESKNIVLSLLTLSVGPLMFNSGISFHDAVDMMLISKALGGDSIQIVGFSSLIRYLSVCVTIYFAQSTIAKIAALIGAGKKEDAEQVITDLFRISFVSMILVSIMFYFVAIPMLIFMGCTHDIAVEARHYLTPILIGMPFMALFQLSCGFIQSQGRSILCGILQFAAFALNCGCISPILLFAVKVPIKFAGISFALSQSIPGVILAALIFTGKFNIRPKCSMFLRPVSKDTLNALLLGTPYILNILAGAIPPMILLRYMMLAATTSGEAPMIAAAFSVFLKLQSAVNSVSIGINQGLMATGSYARGAGNYTRLIQLYIRAGLITLTYHLCWIPLMQTRADWVAKIWMDDEEQLRFAKYFLRIPFYTNWLIPLNDSAVNFVLASGKPVLAMVPSLLRGTVCLIATFAFYYTGKDKPQRMMYTYNTFDVSVLLFDIGLVIYNLRYLYQLIRENYDVLN